jgi:hypothetical protein
MGSLARQIISSGSSVETGGGTDAAVVAGVVAVATAGVVEAGAVGVMGDAGVVDTVGAAVAVGDVAGTCCAAATIGHSKIPANATMPSRTLIIVVSHTLIAVCYD